MRATHYGFNSFPFVIFVIVIVIEPTVNAAVASHTKQSPSLNKSELLNEFCGDLCFEFLVLGISIGWRKRI